MYSLYAIVKSIHVLAVISWMAGLLYFYRLFVYHFEYGQKNDTVHSLLNMMETKLFQRITLPAMTVAVLTGLGMVHLNPSLLRETWFLIKFGAAFLMIGVTLHGTGFIRKFENKEFKGYSSKKLRLFNEVPTLLMIIIVIMVIVRPF